MIGKSYVGWFSAWKWRIILSVTIVLLTIGMSPWFYSGLLANSPNLHFVLNSLNTIPAQLLNMTFQNQLPHLYWTRGYWPRFLFGISVDGFHIGGGWPQIRPQGGGARLGARLYDRRGRRGIRNFAPPFHRRNMGRAYPYPDADHWVVFGWSGFPFCYSLLQLAQLRTRSQRLAR